MTRTITWKKGMRLSAEPFTAADGAMLDVIRQAVLVSASGRYGLYKTVAPFELALNITSNMVEVVSLTCNAVTKNGTLIDINFDSSYTNTFDSRVAIPANATDEAYLLVVRTHPGEWRDVNETYSEAKYTFELVGENSPIDDNCLPIAAIVNQYGWRMNEDDFVPPCMTITAHAKFMNLWHRATEQMAALCNACAAGKKTRAKTLLAATWHSAKNTQVRLEKEREFLSPESLFAIIQSFVADFCIGCAMEEGISLEDAEPFELYVNQPLNKRTIYRDIEKGLSLCAEIVPKIEAVGKMVEEPEPAPEPKPKPRPKPDSEELRRRRWIGKEV